MEPLYYSYNKINHWRETIATTEQQFNFLFAPEVKTQLDDMFIKVQEPFTIICPPHRKSFFNYSFLIHRFLQTMGKDEYTRYFPLFKSREKMRYNNDLLKKIYEDLNWNVNSWYNLPSMTKEPTYQQLENSQSIVRDLSCYICVELDPNQMVITPCKHVGCWNCFERWFKFKNTCPFCRQPIELQQLQKI